jgi:hypothetical protein
MVSPPLPPNLPSLLPQSTTPDVFLYSILLYNQSLGSVTFWCGSGSNSGSDSFLHWFKDAKKIFFYIVFLITCHRHIIIFSIKFQFLLKFCVKILFSIHYFSSLNLFMRKGKDPDPYRWLMDPDPGGPKTCGSCESGSGSPTLFTTPVAHLENG